MPDTERNVIRFEASRPDLTALGVDDASIEVLCQRGLPVAFDEEIVVRRSLAIHEDRIEFADHLSLGPVWVAPDTGRVFVGRLPNPTLVNSDLGRFGDTVDAVTSLVSELLVSDDWHRDAEQVRGVIAAIDEQAAAPGTFWDSVRESVSIGDWARDD